MLVAGLTGGVGSGKSAAATLFGRHGAVIIDADVIAREVVASKTVGFEAVVSRFGPTLIAPDGFLDRSALASIVFSDEEARSDLNSIVHPLVRERIQARLDYLRDGDEIVILVIPLLLESGHYDVDVIIVVDVPDDVSVARVVQSRGWTEKQARARLDAQIGRTQRRSAADLIIDNSGTIDDLTEQVDGAWAWLSGLRDKDVSGSH